MAGLLAGVRVVEFTHVWAGPYCGRLCADFGADVIKVESATRFDLARTLGPFPAGQDGNPDAAGYFIEWNRGKRSISLDLKHPQGVRLAKQLVRTADVVIENFAPGVLDRLGLGYAALRAERPDLIMLSITGLGLTGPEAQFVAFGQQIEALSGLMAVTGYPGGGPLKPGVPYSDPIGALTGATALLAALVHRRRTGEGQHIDLSMWEATTALLSGITADYAINGRTPAPSGNSDPNAAPQGCFPCRGDDRWLVLATPTARAWAGLAQTVGRPDWLEDPRLAAPAGRAGCQAELAGAIQAWSRDRDRDEAVRQLQEHGVPAAPVNSVPDLLSDPHLEARHFFQSIDHPVVGPMRYPRFPARFSDAESTTAGPAPLLGEHSNAILSELLGLSEAEIAALKAEGVIA